MLLEFAGDADVTRMELLLQNGARADIALEDGDSAFFHLLDRAGHAQPALLYLLDRGTSPSGLGGLSCNFWPLRVRPVVSGGGNQRNAGSERKQSSPRNRIQL